MLDPFQVFYLSTQLDNYRVTHLLVQNLPLTSKAKFRFGLACPVQDKAEIKLLKSTGGFAQGDGSPCTVL